MANPGFFEGRYSEGSTNDVQRIAREVIARQAIEEHHKPDKFKPVRAALDAAALNPMHGLMGLTSDVAAARHLDMSAAAVDSRIQTNRYLNRPPPQNIPFVTLSAAQIAAGGRDLKRRISQAIVQESFLRQYGRTIDLLVMNRVCTRCRNNFTYVNSINAWQCRGHTKHHDGVQWLCCGNPVIPADIYALRTSSSGCGYGCTPMDHIDLDLHESGVTNSTAWWKIPLELVKAFEGRKFWKPIEGSALFGERFQVLWDVRDKRDVEINNAARHAAAHGADADSDDEDRVIVETRVKKGKWASLEHSMNDYTPRYSHCALSGAELSAYSAEQTRKLRERNREYARKDFVFLPSSPVCSGPYWLVASNRFDLVKLGPIRGTEAAIQQGLST